MGAIGSSSPLASIQVGYRLGGRPAMPPAEVGIGWVANRGAVVPFRMSRSLVADGMQVETAGRHPYNRGTAIKWPRTFVHKCPNGTVQSPRYPKWPNPILELTRPAALDLSQGRYCIKPSDLPAEWPASPNVESPTAEHGATKSGSPIKPGTCGPGELSFRNNAQLCRAHNLPGDGEPIPGMPPAMESGTCFLPDYAEMTAPISSGEVTACHGNWVRYDGMRRWRPELPEHPTGHFQVLIDSDGQPARGFCVHICHPHSRLSFLRGGAGSVDAGADDGPGDVFGAVQGLVSVANALMRPWLGARLPAGDH